MTSPHVSAASPTDLAIDDLRVFVAVAEVGSFTAAAELTGYTQSGVSRRVAALERAAGAPLFRRLPRGVRLAPAGEALSAHATVLLEAMDAAVAAVAAVRRGTGGRLRVGSFATADAVLVPSVVADLRREAPDLATTVTEGLTRDLVAGCGPAPSTSPSSATTPTARSTTRASCWSTCATTSCWWRSRPAIG